MFWLKLTLELDWTPKGPTWSLSGLYTSYRSSVSYRGKSRPWIPRCLGTSASDHVPVLGPRAVLAEPDGLPASVTQLEGLRVTDRSHWPLGLRGWDTGPLGLDAVRRNNLVRVRAEMIGR